MKGGLPHEPAQAPSKSRGWSKAHLQAVLYGTLNIVSASGIVFANKLVFQHYDFHFTYALTWVHTCFTLLGMRIFARMGMFQVKELSQGKVAPLAAAYVGYIVLCNLSLKVNTVGFYQVMKIAVAPTVLLLELLLFRKIPSTRVISAVALVCAGIAFATLTDSKILANLSGVGVGVAATVTTALYQIWAGSKQKELRSSSMQLLYAYTPQAALYLGILVPLCEPLGRRSGGQPFSPGSLLAFHYTPAAVAAILFSAVLGLLVSLSTFLVIGATSSLTYNVVGHLKTVIILTGGCLLFGDDMPPRKLIGVLIAMAGIVWYSQIQLAGTSGVGVANSTAASRSGAARALNGDILLSGHSSRRSLLPQFDGDEMASMGGPRSVYTAVTGSRLLSTRRGAGPVTVNGQPL